jgi:hypothetical protein
MGEVLGPFCSSTNSEKLQIPPDLVVKSQAIDVVDVIL